MARAARGATRLVVVCAPFGFVGGVEEDEDEVWGRVSWDVESSRASL